MLKVKGKKVLTSTGQEIRLLGVNRAGLEWDAKDERIIESVKQACDDWKCNVIRIPVSQDRWFGFAQEQQKDDVSGEKYRKVVDEILEAIHSRGKYMILDLHWNNMNEWGYNESQHKMPCMNSLLFWKDAAVRYKNHPAVLFSLYNEAHDVSWDVWKSGGYVTESYDHDDEDGHGTSAEYTYLSPGYQKMVDAVRGVGANNIVVIGGLDWAFTLEEIMNGYEINDHGGNGIIYDTHIYPWKPLNWDAYIKDVAEKYPILVGEFGHYGNDANNPEGPQALPHEEFMPRLLEWIHKNGFHFTAWVFHPNCGPDMLKNWDNEPTEYFGVYVREYLMGMG